MYPDFILNVSCGGVNKPSPIEYTIWICRLEVLNQKTSRMSSFILIMLLLGLTASNITCALPQTQDLSGFLIYHVNNNYLSDYNGPR